MTSTENKVWIIKSKMMNPYRLILPMLICLACSESDGGNCFDTDCTDYGSQAEAQTDYSANPGCHRDLDADRDGLACEDLFRSTANHSGSSDRFRYAEITVPK